MEPLIEADLPVVLGRSPDKFPDHFRPWGGAPGGGWRFWANVYHERLKELPDRSLDFD